MRATRSVGSLGLLVAALLVAGCGSSSTSSAPASSPSPAATAAATPSTGPGAHSTRSSKPPPSAGAVPASGGTEWAQAASATSNYGTNPGDPWNASQAIGPPDVTACGDDGYAWASLDTNTTETLTLTYAQPLLPTAVNVVETFNPGYVKTITVSGSGGQTATIYTGTPALVSQCPTTLTVPITTVTFPVSTVAVTVDESSLDSWAEIDGVGLLGKPAG
jgi:hypothetical protein